MAAAEEALQVRLFIREPTGYHATDAGKVFLAHAEAIFDCIGTMLLEEWPNVLWLGYPIELTRMPEMQWLAQIEPRQVVRMSSVSMIVLGCQAGAGLALLPCLAADAAGLERLDPEPVLHRELWLLSHRDASQVTRFRLVADWLVNLFEQEAAALRGDR